MPRYEEMTLALAWRLEQLPSIVTAEQLASAMTIEELPYAKIPDHLWYSVHAFRRLREDARIRAAHRYLIEQLAHRERSRGQ